MIGWFVAATPGICSDCGRKTRTNERVLYPASDATDTQRLCVGCGYMPRDLLELIEAMSA